MPNINVRQKGASGETEISKILDPIIVECMRFRDIDPPLGQIVQRNQNQSAVGGSDLTNTFGLCIEVKRQEALSVNTWWAQCTAAATRNNELPVLLYRQNRKAWRCVLPAWIALPTLPGATVAHVQARAEISLDDFEQWFRNWVDRKLQLGERPRV